MAKILLDYLFPISVISPTPEASTAFLKQVCLVVKPTEENPEDVGTVTMCTTSAQVAALTDNENADQLFAAGMSKVYILVSDDLNIEDAINDNLNLFYTVLISDDFVDADILSGEITAAVAATIKIQDITYTAVTAGTGGNSITVAYTGGATAGAEVVSVIANAISVQIETGVSTAQQIADAIEADEDAMALISLAIDSGDNGDTQVTVAATNLAGGTAAVTGEGGFDVGLFTGVIGISTNTEAVAAAQAAIENRCAFFASVANGAENMCYAFGSMLSNQSTWSSQQYISMPLSDDIDALGEATNLFDQDISFVIEDDEYSNRLALFACGGKAITAPYIIKDLQINLQSAALSWISGNQPKYTLKEAALLEARLQEDVVNDFISNGLIEDGIVEITLENDNFVASGDINVSEPKALWRVVSELRQTL